MPKFINKWAAATYIKDNYYTGPIIAAGDSQFDEEMVIKADYGIIPRGAYIEKELNKDNIVVTARNGIEASTDIVEYSTNIFTEYTDIAL